MAQVGEDVAVGQLDALGYTLGAAGEQHDGGLLGRDVELSLAKRGLVLEQDGQLGQAGNLLAHVLKINELDAGLLHWLDVQSGFSRNARGGDDLFQSGQLEQVCIIGVPVV